MNGYADDGHRFAGKNLVPSQHHFIVHWSTTKIKNTKQTCFTNINLRAKQCAAVKTNCLSYSAHPQLWLPRYNIWPVHGQECGWLSIPPTSRCSGSFMWKSYVIFKKNGLKKVWPQKLSNKFFLKISIVWGLWKKWIHAYHRIETRKFLIQRSEAAFTAWSGKGKIKCAKRQKECIRKMIIFA